MKEVTVGTNLKINNWIAEVIKIEGNHALLRCSDGSQICYNILGIRQSRILEVAPEEKLNPGTQLTLL